ncbi:MAG: TRAP transporter small permease [Spirochaetales bacterium]
MLVRHLQQFATWINKIVEYLCGTLLGILTLTVLVGVFFRYVLIKPLGWTEELARYLMIWTASLAISVGIFRGEHIGLTFIPDRIKGKLPSLILSVTIDLFVLIFLTVLFYFSIPMVQQGKFQIAQSLPIKMTIPMLSIPVSMVLALVQLGIKLYLTLAGTSFKFEEKSHIDL